jgi:hypothetical protein
MQMDNTKYRTLLSCALSFVGVLAVACSGDDAPIIVQGGGGTEGTTTSTGAMTTGATGSAGTLTGSTSTTGSASSGAGGAGTGGTGGSGGLGGTDGGTCSTPDIDTDMDGTPDCRDDCPYDKNKVTPGMCFCGFADNDSDGDGVIDCLQGHFYEAENGVLSNLAGDAGPPSTDGGPITGPFVILADTAASAGHYIATSTGVTSVNSPGTARASYDLNITSAAMYVIWGRFFSPDAAHNCVWARIDTGIWTKWSGTTGEEWFWYHLHKEGEWATPLPFDLSVGHHNLEIANCSDNTKFDRLYVTASGDKPPGDTTCNPPHTVAIGGVCRSSCGQLGGTSCDTVVCAGQTLLPAYDCTVCCAPAGEAGTADAGGTSDSASDIGRTE